MRRATRGELVGPRAEGTGVQPVGQPVRDDPGEHLGGGVHPGERRVVVEVAVGQRTDDGVQLVGRPPDVDDDPVVVEPRPAERRVDHERRAVQLLRRAEHLAAQAVGHHHVVPDGQAEHGTGPVP